MKGIDRDRKLVNLKKFEIFLRRLQMTLILIPLVVSTVATLPDFLPICLLCLTNHLDICENQCRTDSDVNDAVISIAPEPNTFILLGIDACAKLDRAR